MDENTTTNLSDLVESTAVDIRVEAMSHVYYKVAEAINKVYFPIFVPIGVLGNILSFLVMIQRHNRHMSISVYIAALAVSDTIVLGFAFLTYVNVDLKTAWPSDRLLFCKVQMIILVTYMQCSTLLIVFMTFDRFYSIIRPHKAASFNTVKRAKITIASVVIFCHIFVIPHFFFTTVDGHICVPYALYAEHWFNEAYFWVSRTVGFIFPFTSLAIMNGVIISTLRNRLRLNIITGSTSQGQGQGQVQGEGQPGGIRSNEKQIYIILILIICAFFILTIPIFALVLYGLNVDYTKSSQGIAEYFLFYSVSQKAIYTNHGINFFLYVMSGRKFRTDLARLFKRSEKSQSEVSRSVTEISSLEK